MQTCFGGAQGRFRGCRILQKEFLLKNTVGVCEFTISKTSELTNKSEITHLMEVTLDTCCSFLSRWAQRRRFWKKSRHDSVIFPVIDRVHVCRTIQGNSRASMLLAERIAHVGDGVHGQFYVHVLRLDADNAPGSDFWRC